MSIRGYKKEKQNEELPTLAQPHRPRLHPPHRAAPCPGRAGEQAAGEQRKAR